jgi:RNA polymerase sigma-70 factor, ECF subfamily
MIPSAQEPTSSPGAGGLSDEELVEHILAGNTACFDILFERYNAKLCAYAIHLTDVEVGYDLAKQAFEKAYKNLPSLRDGVRFRPWLYQIAKNEIQDYLRRKKIFCWIPWKEVKDEAVEKVVCAGTFGQESLEHVIEDKEFIRGAIRHVSPKYRHCTYLAIFEDMKPPEIAEVLVMNERTARRYVQKGMQELYGNYDKLVVEIGALRREKN